MVSERANNGPCIKTLWYRAEDRTTFGLQQTMANSQPKGPGSAEEAAQAASPKTFLSPLGVNAGAATGKIDRSQIEGPTNVAVKAFRLLLDQAKRNRDETVQPASFQYTLWFMLALVLGVTVVGVVLLSDAARRQRSRATTSAEDEAKKTTTPGLPKREYDGDVINKEGRWATEDDEGSTGYAADLESAETDTALDSVEDKETTEATDAYAGMTTA
ncbi:uncharacterized protein LOC144102298 [Amblyomma americanum]